MMKLTGLAVTCIMIGIFCVVPGGSADYSYGARAGAMGGAYTAVADDASAIYWIPAASAVIREWSIGLEYGSELEVAEDVQKLLDRFEGMSPSDMSSEELDHFLEGFDGKEWTSRGGDHVGFAIANRQASLTLQGYQVFYVEPEIDPDDPAQSRWRLTGVDVKEYGMNYAWMNQGNSVAMGITAKYVDLKAYDSSVGLWDMDSYDAGDMMNEVDNGVSRSKSDWGLDAGLMFYFAKSRLGFTGRNLNTVSVDFDEDLSFSIKPEYRIGYAYTPSQRFTYSVDYAITDNRNPRGESIDGSEVAMGFEGVFGQTGWLILRGGASMELGGDLPLLMSGGIGLKFTNVIFDFAYVTDPDRDSEKLWGGLRIFFKEPRRRR